MQTGLLERMPAVVDGVWLRDQLQEYRSPSARVQKLIRDGWLMRLKPGLYLNSAYRASPEALGLCANRLYGPSYVSFSWALRWYRLIPEDVPNLTSATYRRRRRKRFATRVGTFFYRDVRAEVFPHGTRLESSSPTVRFVIASPQKALLDTLSTVSGVRSRAAVRALLVEDLRIDQEELRQYSFADEQVWAGAYRSTAVDSFLSMLNDGRVYL